MTSFEVFEKKKKKFNNYMTSIHLSFQVWNFLMQV